jgi:ribosomal protein S12 methylthiotransferase
VTRRYWVETLGCPKNQVDSDKLVGTLAAEGMAPADRPEAADVVVVNTCAFIEAAREESIETILALSAARRPGARLVITGCMAERYGAELAEAVPEADAVLGFGVPLAAPTGTPPALDLLNLPRPPASAPWAYVKVAEGCDRACGFCAIPSFRGPQRSRSVESVLAEVDGLDVAEIVLVAQDLARYGHDDGRPGAIVPLVRAVAARVRRVRLLYLYPSELSDGLIEAVCETGVPYFDLSLQHVSRPLVRRMRRWGDGERFLERVRTIRQREPDAAFRSSFILGYPGETEDDHDQLLAFVEEARLDWGGFFPYSQEVATYAAALDGGVAPALARERLAEVSEVQDRITAERRAALVGEEIEVLVDAPGLARSHREAPEIDGVVHVPARLATGSFAPVTVCAAAGPDVEAH